MESAGRLVEVAGWLVGAAGTAPGRPGQATQACFTSRSQLEGNPSANVARIIMVGSRPLNSSKQVGPGQG